MTMIVFSGSISDGANEFIGAIEELCAARGINLEVKVPGDDMYIMIASKAPATIATDAMTADVPPSAVISQDEVMAMSANEMVPPMAEPSAEPMDTVPQTEVPPEAVPAQEAMCCEMIILSLTTECAVPAMYDRNSPVSALYAANVSFADGYACFEYCGAVYKFPHISSMNNGDYVNTPMQSDINGIRVVIQSTSSGRVYPIVVEVREKMEVAPYSILFGEDLTLVAQQEMVEQA